MSNNMKMVRIPPYIGEEPLVGRYYMAECERCGWLGSSSELTDDCQCTREVDGAYCLGHTLEVEPEQLFAIIQAMAKPTEQHQGEPVALAIPEECPHIIVFDDADRANEHFCGAGARTAALRRYEQISQAWNAHLFVRVARNSRDDRYPSATAADLGEVERLRKASVFVQRLVDCAGTQQSVATGYVRDILDVLKGNAAPSGPVARDERAEYEAACHRRAKANGRSYQSHYFRRSQATGAYLNSNAQFGWEVWQMRAGLEVKL